MSCSTGSGSGSGRVVRLVGLASPTDDFGRIRRALSHSDLAPRSSALELIEPLVPGPRPAITLAFLGASDEELLAEAADWVGPRPTSVMEVLDTLESSHSESLRLVAEARRRSLVGRVA